MKPTEEQSIAENLNKALEEMQKVVKQFNLVREHNESEQPKFAVGERYKYNEILRSSYKSYNEKPCTLLSIIGADAYWVKVMFDDGRKATIRYDELSPLPEMYVGRKWVLKQDGNPWDGFEVECVGDRLDCGDYEQYWDNHGIYNRFYPTKGNSGDVNCFIIICIDPAFWTGEICGEKVRVYEDNDKIYLHNIDGYYRCYSQNSEYLDGKVWLAAIKDADIPIMPYSQSQGKYDPPEEK